MITIFLGVTVLFLLFLALPSFSPVSQKYGVSFSAPQAEGLGLNWKEVYTSLLDEIGVKHLRLSAYWDTIETKKGVYDFSSLDYQIREAHKRDADVLLAVGRKLPRWPECHIPKWAQGLSEEEQQRHVLALISRVVERYKDRENLSMWQLENEPLLSFGICPSADTAFLTKEQNAIRALDSSHKILITDSGELNSWLGASGYGDILGTTMYRTVFSKRTQKLFHYDYLFPSWLYRLKGRYIGLLRNKDVIISELQGEPWGNRPFSEMSQEERHASFSPERFMQIAKFARRTQFPLAYWWGAEYWYWERVKNNDSSYMDIAKNIFSFKGGELHGK